MHQLLWLSFVLVVALQFVIEQFRSCIRFLLVPLLVCGPHTIDEEGGNGLGGLGGRYFVDHDSLSINQRSDGRDTFSRTYQGVY